MDEAQEEATAYKDMQKKLTDALKRAFRPEFINRLDSVIVFRSLNQENIRKIVQLELNKVNARLEENRIHLRASEAALDLLSKEGYRPEMGARPLRRVIQQKIEDRLSDALLSKEFSDGQNILVDVETTLEDGAEVEKIILKQDKEGAQEGEPDLAAVGF